MAKPSIKFYEIINEITNNAAVVAGEIQPNDVEIEIETESSAHLDITDIEMINGVLTIVVEDTDD